MTVSIRDLGIDQLDVEGRLALVEEIWASICAEEAHLPLSDGQRAELNRRKAEDVAFPDEVVPWDEVKNAAKERLRR